MQITLPDNHPSFTCAYGVNEMLNSYFPNSPLSFFSIMKIHQDGSVSFIMNNAELLKSFLKTNTHKAHSCAKPEFIDKHSYWFLVEKHLRGFPFELTRAFNVSNGLCFLERYSNCYYMISFGTHNHFEGALDYYLSNFETLRNFIRYALETKTEYIDSLNHNRIVLPPEAQDPNKDILLLNKSKKVKFPLFHDGIECYITFQEFECIRLYSFGKTAKEIARILGISHRTVENYFNRAMIRTGCKNKRQLSLLINQHVQ